MPVCNTYLHVHLDHVVLAYDHCRIVKGSPLKFKYVAIERIVYFFI